MTDAVSAVVTAAKITVLVVVTAAGGSAEDATHTLAAILCSRVKMILEWVAAFGISVVSPSGYY